IQLSVPMIHLHHLVLGCFGICSLAWRVQMPRDIVALYGSCLVIPCSFDYNQNPPVRPNRVVWYQYVSRGYPLVYDDWYPDSVINKFKGKTRVSTTGRSCTLQISPVTWSHHKEKLYPWVDPENVGSIVNYIFFCLLTFSDRATKPNLMVIGDMKVGQYVTVQCSVVHTCHFYPPSLNLNIPLKEHSLKHSRLTDGTSKTTLRTVMFVERDQQTVECVVKHTGGATEKTTLTLNAKCRLERSVMQRAEVFPLVFSVFIIYLFAKRRGFPSCFFRFYYLFIFISYTPIV
uniref:Ig-like domain-containing protein n=1 Tax=Periophthalmus magnuspinnatus TaxID=409849 RepID=A0A3B4BI79_9GOBI